MELPISNASYRPATDVLVRAVRRAAVALARTVAQESETEAAICFTNPDRPGVRSANFAAEVTLKPPDTAEHVLDGVVSLFESRGAPCHAVDCAGEGWDPTLAEHLSRCGYRPVTRRLYVLESLTAPPVPVTSLQIIPARAAYNELRLLYDRMARRDHAADDRLARDLTQTYIDRLDEPRLDLFLARAERRSVAVAGVLSLGQIGVINPAYCEPESRGRGVAAALMRHVLEHCHRSLFEQVVVDRAEGCYAIPFYEKLGFSPAGSYVKYRREPAP